MVKEADLESNDIRWTYRPESYIYFELSDGVVAAKGAINHWTHARNDIGYENIIDGKNRIIGLQTEIRRPKPGDHLMGAHEGIIAYLHKRKNREAFDHVETKMHPQWNAPRS